MDTVTSLLAEQVRRAPDAAAVIYRDRPISFAELETQSRRVAGALEALGVGAGDRVALWLPNVPAYLALYFACARLGAIAVAVNTRFRSAEVADIVGRTSAKVLALWPDFRQIDFLEILSAVDRQALEQLQAVVLYDEGRPAAALPASVAHCRRLAYAELAAHEPLAADLAAPERGCGTFTTSGTTKAPKLVLHQQRSIARHARIVADGFGYAGSDGAALLALPLCGTFGLSQIMATLAAGRPTVLTSIFNATECLGLIERWNVRHMNATDDMVHDLLEASRREIALPTVRYCGYAGFNASLDDIVERADRRGLTLVGLYGMSEVQALFARQPPDAPAEQRRLGGGIPVAEDARVRVRDPETGRLLGHGESGELELRGPSQMAEYYLNPEATAEAITADGFIRTGDMGYTTPEGGFVFVSRMGDVLRLGGFLVSPAEIEGHIQQHPSVEGCQVVGVTTEKGTRPVAFVTLEPGAGFDEQALLRHCLDGLARFKAPMRIFALEAFPTTASANGTKIQRARLRQMAIERVTQAPVTG